MTYLILRGGSRLCSLLPFPFVGPLLGGFFGSGLLFCLGRLCLGFRNRLGRRLLLSLDRRFCFLEGGIQLAFGGGHLRELGLHDLLLGS